MGNSKWILGALILSVVLNLALAGYLLGQGNQPRQRWLSPDPAAGYFRALGVLPEQRRQELSPLIRNHLDSMRPEIRATRQLLRSINQNMRADVLDETRMAQDLAELRRLYGLTQEASHNSFLELVSALSAEERRHLADALRRRGNTPASAPADADN